MKVELTSKKQLRVKMSASRYFFSKQSRFQELRNERAEKQSRVARKLSQQPFLVPQPALSSLSQLLFSTHFISFLFPFPVHPFRSCSRVPFRESKQREIITFRREAKIRRGQKTLTKEKIRKLCVEEKNTTVIAHSKVYTMNVGSFYFLNNRLFM